METLELQQMEMIEGGGVCGYLGGAGVIGGAIAGLKYTKWGGPKSWAFGVAVGAAAGGVCALYS